jgi:hypothetical protein
VDDRRSPRRPRAGKKINVHLNGCGRPIVDRDAAALRDGSAERDMQMLSGCGIGAADHDCLMRFADLYLLEVGKDRECRMLPKLLRRPAVEVVGEVDTFTRPYGSSSLYCTLRMNTYLRAAMPSPACRDGKDGGFSTLTRFGTLSLIAPTSTSRLVASLNQCRGIDFSATNVPRPCRECSVPPEDRA